VLKVDKINVGYGSAQVLRNVSLEVHEGEIVSIVGSNGAGKTTLLLAISGLVKPTSGRVDFFGKRTDRLGSNDIVKMGIAHVPEGRQIFTHMSVLENLQMGAYVCDKKEMSKSLPWIFELFPILELRKNQEAGTLSGGEQQMLAIGRGLMMRPKLLMLDEPSLGLAPILVSKILETLKEINNQGVTILLVEQNIHRALALANRGYVLENGEFVLEGSGKKLLEMDKVKKTYLGI